MIQSILIIDGETGISILEHQFSTPKTTKEPFFQAITYLIDDIRTNIKNNRKIPSFSRMMMISPDFLVFYYHSPSNVLFTCLADADDIKEELMKLLQSLARRFWKKWNYELEKFRTSHQNKIFQSFIMEIEILSMYGKIGENFPHLRITQKTLTRLQEMETISEQEKQIALLCRGFKSPLQISQELNIEYDQVQLSIQRLKRIDILEDQNSIL